MPPKRKQLATVAAPSMLTKSPSASPSKSTSRPSSSQEQRRGSEEQREVSNTFSTPKRPSRGGRLTNGEAIVSPAMPAAPASSPVPNTDPTAVGDFVVYIPSPSPKKGGDAKSVPASPRATTPKAQQSPFKSASRTATPQATESTSPAPPPPPPSTPAPVTKPTSKSATPAASQNPTMKQSTKADSKLNSAAASPAKSEEPTKSSAAAVTEKAGDSKAVTSNKANRQRASQKRRSSSATSRNGSSAASSPVVRGVEHLIQTSKVIAPDVSGLRCMAVHPNEQQLVVAREDGSLVLYDASFFQNIPQFVQRRHTGGQTRRTIMSLAYVKVPFAAFHSTESATSVGESNTVRYVLVAAMMSGQIVVYDAELLTPLSLHQRSGGAIWQLTCVEHKMLYAAMADGSWQQLRLVSRRGRAAPELELVRVVPGVPGADRALTVAVSASLRMAVGTDDAGNVHAWRLPVMTETGGEDEEAADGSAPGQRTRGLAEHESLWTTKLSKGIALSCAVVGGTGRPCVVVGTSMGDVVLLDAAHGHVFQTFSQHKGPVTTLVVLDDAVVYASGWHESLRSYRCSAVGDWYPGEVKRRTHYHEASQLALLPQRRLLLSAARDGTIMYAPVAQLFTTPAMYVTVTTQQFAYAAGRGILLQSRFDTIEAFRMDAAGCHWVPFFAHRLDGRFHLTGLWCDPHLSYIFFSTEERVGLLHVSWRTRGGDSVHHMEEVLELPARSGAVDARFCRLALAATPDVRKSTKKDDENENDNEEEEEENIPVASKKSRSRSFAVVRVLYILYDDMVSSVTLADGYPAVHTPITVSGKSLPGGSLRPYRLLCRPTITPSPGDKTRTTAWTLSLYGHRGCARLRLLPDGTPDLDSLEVDLEDLYSKVREVPDLRRAPRVATSTTTATEATGSVDQEEEDDEDEGQMGRKKSRKESNGKPNASPVAWTTSVVVGLSAVQHRYLSAPILAVSAAAASMTAMAPTLPHDVQWIARLPASSTTAASVDKYIGYFSRGLIVASGDSWHMIRRMSVEAAFVIQEGTAVLVLERNLEKSLEALPLTWKVRRFGN